MFFSFSSKGQTSFKTENNRSSNTYLYFNSYYTESYPVLHIKKDTEKENQSIITGDAKGIK